MVDDVSSRVVCFSNEFPGDNIPQLFRSLYKRSKTRNFPLLASFLESCTLQLQEEIARLPQPLRKLLPHFSNVLTISECFQDLKHGPIGGALDSALLCIVELGMLIGHHEALDIQYDLAKCETLLFGLSIGLVAGAAVSVASSLHELSKAGIESVRIAFRIGIRVDQVSQTLEARDGDCELASWAFVVTGVSPEAVQRELDTYNNSSSNPSVTNVFISANDKSSVSVSGPPSRLKNAFRMSPVLRYAKFSPMPVYGGLCHAPHVYDVQDIDFVLHGTPSAYCHSRKVILPLLSSDTGRTFTAPRFGLLLQEICAEILTGTIHLDNIIDGILQSTSEKVACNVLLFHTPIISRAILTGMESKLEHTTLSRRDVTEWSRKEFQDEVHRASSQSKLAIVGMSCRIPGGADNMELFWDLMVNKHDVHTQVPVDRFDIATHVNSTGKTPNTSETPYGNFINSPGLFDAGFFNMSPKEAEQTDPMHRLALVTAYEALEMAGYTPNRTPSTNIKRVGTYYGQASDDWREVNAGQDIGTYGVPGGERAFANGRINYFFKFGGPSFNIDTACSSGLAAVQASCSALWAGEADTVVAGGLSVITNPDNYCMLSRGHFLSKTGQCKVWDESADGYCRADGIGSVVIKRLEDAERDNDKIIGVIAAAATNHSAESASITQPHAGAQIDNYRQVLQAAAINPYDVSYIELHGTGTQVGDAVESESIASVFAPLRPVRPAGNTLYLGAVKSNIGHGEAAAGIASLLKALLVFRKCQIPPHVGIVTTMNPVVLKNIEKRNITLVTENTPWVKPIDNKRYALVNSFGAHGGNTTLLLEDAPEKIKNGEDTRKAHVISVSAKSKQSLTKNIDALREYLEQNPETSLADLSYTTCARRMHHNTRIATSVSSISQLHKFFQESTDVVSGLRPIPLSQPSVVFVFTGQGAFYNGIGSQLFRHFPSFRSCVIDLDRVVTQLGFPSIIPSIEGADETSFDPVITQLTILVIQIALVRFWDLLGVRPIAVIGHSLGEYAALVAASILSVTDAIYLVGRRAELILTHCKRGAYIMMSVMASSETIQKLAGGHPYEISCINGVDETVVSGSHEAIVSIRNSLSEKGIKAVPLELPFAFHTSQLDPMLEEFETISSHVAFKTPAIPIISPTISTGIFDGKTVNAEYLRAASREKVDFIGALDAARELGITDDKTVWLEIGPHPVCSAFIRSHVPGSKTICTFRKNVDNFVTINNALVSLHCEGIPICWNEYYRPYEKTYSLLHLPAYCWNEKNYWIPYVGTWTLDKAFPNDKPRNSSVPVEISSRFQKTSSVQQVILEEFSDAAGLFVAVSDINSADLYSAFQGHMMNGYGVATTTIWADMALSVAEYLYKRLAPITTTFVPMNLANMQVFHAQVVSAKSTSPQKIQIEAHISLEENRTGIKWFNIGADGCCAAEAFASASVFYEDPERWQDDWARVSHLVTSRIDALTQSVNNPKDSTISASRLSSAMSYTLFKNVVDYADHFRGMQNVVLSGFEAFADVMLPTERHGTWHTPPHYADGAFHLAGFIMNASDVLNNRDFFYVTPGWDNFRSVEPIQAGVDYKSYVKMTPAKEEENMYAGDVYLLRGDRIVALMERIKFKRIPRILMDKFFSPHEGVAQHNTAANNKTSRVLPSLAEPAHGEKLTGTHMSRENVAVAPPKLESIERSKAKPAPEVIAKDLADESPLEENSITADALDLIASETGILREELRDEASFNALGIDSLMSLVLSEKFRSKLGVEVKSSVFLEYPTIKDLKTWLEQYC
ncbi:putative polyketide synthase [Tothia fuscella]|uniref:Polyketide synthase n=1 Tax=Tothia fuscella TaxID=1048955 RepID=A0A9P4NGE2_9PEZI|nr:putative polyketide synthase [Tothia fuscella]